MCQYSGDYEQLVKWQQQANNHYLMDYENQLISQCLSSLSINPTLCRVLIMPSAKPLYWQCQVAAISHFHTIPASSLQCVIIPHWFNYMDDTAATLLEINSRLVANGKLVILNYNAISKLGLQCMFNHSAVEGMPKRFHKKSIETTPLFRPLMKSNYMSCWLPLIKRVEIERCWYGNISVLTLHKHSDSNQELGSKVQFELQTSKDIILTPTMENQHDA